MNIDPIEYNLPQFTGKQNQNRDQQSLLENENSDLSMRQFSSENATSR